MAVEAGHVPTSAAAVANEFLELGWRTAGVPPIDQMKLQKLLFYAHAWYLAQTGTPLFGEDFEAWPWGPVVRDVYYQTREFGKAPVAKLISALSDQGSLDFEFTNPKIDDDQVKQYIVNVWNSHKAFSGTQLSNSTHLPGEPWTIVKNKYGSLERKPTIPNDLISAVFKQKMSNAAPSSTPAGESAG